MKFLKSLIVPLAALAVGAAFSAPAPAHAQSIIKARAATGGGARTIDVDDTDGIFLSNSTARTVFASAARTVTANSTDQVNYAGKGLVCTLDVTAASGTTPTLDVKIQVKDTVSAKYTDLPNAAFAQKTATSTAMLVVYPGITTSANAAVSGVVPRDWRAVATIGGTTPSFTFTLACLYVQ